MTLDAAGNLYGTAAGGANDLGVVYKVDPSGQETVLHNFAGGADGESPYSSLVLDAAGNLYGTTVAGGPAGAGVVFKIDASGNETVLHSFECAGDGCYPYSGLVLGPAGNLYGTTSGGGKYSGGVLFMLDPTG